MGGGRTGKPLSSLEKRQRKALEQRLRQQLRARKKEEARKVALGTIDEGLIRRAQHEVRGQKAITPYMLSSRMGIPMSLAKKVLRVLADRGVIKLVDKSRRLAIYTTA